MKPYENVYVSLRIKNDLYLSYETLEYIYI